MVLGTECENCSKSHTCADCDRICLPLCRPSMAPLYAETIESSMCDHHRQTRRCYVLHTRRTIHVFVLIIVRMDEHLHCAASLQCSGLCLYATVRNINSHWHFRVCSKYGALWRRTHEHILAMPGRVAGGGLIKKVCFPDQLTRQLDGTYYTCVTIFRIPRRRSASAGRCCPGHSRWPQ